MVEEVRMGQEGEGGEILSIYPYIHTYIHTCMGRSVLEMVARGERRSWGWRRRRRRSWSWC